MAAKKKTDLHRQLMEMKARGEKLFLTKKRFLGLDTGYPMMNIALDGLQNELYILAGASAMGKTTFVTQLCWQLAQKNEDLHVIYLSLDQSSNDITAKLVSQAGEVPVDYVLHPFPVDEELDELRIRALTDISSLKERITLLDDVEISVPELKKNITLIRRENPEKRIFVLIDPLLKIRTESDENSFTESFRRVLLELKKLTRSYNCGILVSYGLSKNAELRRPERKDLLEIPEILSLSYIVMTLYCDYVINMETPFLEWDLSGRDIMIPISELNIVKNKMRMFHGRLFYRYFASLARYRECVEEDNENYSQMIGNLDYHKEKIRMKDRQLLERQLLKEDRVDV